MNQCIFYWTALDVIQEDLHTRLIREHKDWTLEQWKKVMWSDESRFTLFQSDGNIREKRGKDDLCFRSTDTSLPTSERCAHFEKGGCVRAALAGFRTPPACRHINRAKGLLSSVRASTEIWSLCSAPLPYVIIKSQHQIDQVVERGGSISVGQFIFKLLAEALMESDHQRCGIPPALSCHSAEFDGIISHRSFFMMYIKETGDRLPSSDWMVKSPLEYSQTRVAHAKACPVRREITYATFTRSVG
ncbi:hypothetical protein P4O66_012838, partial [Electrophorus voltai]